MDLELLTEYLVWSDTRLINILKGLSDEEFHREFNELAGNIHTKTAHIISVYDFFIRIFEGRPYDSFPDLSHLSKDELLGTWESILETWPEYVKHLEPDSLHGMPLAGMQRVEARHVFVDALLHTVHHRGQLLTFVRLLGKGVDEVSPRDTNLDYLMFHYLEHPSTFHPPAVEDAAPV